METSGVGTLGIAWFRLRVYGRKLPLLFRHLGAWGALRYLARRVARMLGGSPATSTGNDVIGFYGFVTAPPIDVPVPKRYAARSMNWVIPHFEVGSGGHMTIFRMIWHLERLGYHCQLVLTGPTQYRDPRQVRRLIRRHFQPLRAPVALGDESLQPAEFTVATSWETAYVVRRFPATRYKLYFIQDFEPDFFPQSSHWIFAEATYRFGFTALTAGEWLAELMRNRYGLQAYSFGFSYDKAHHQPRPRRSGPMRVFFYARNVTPRRGFELGLLTLGLVHAVRSDVEFVLAGWDTTGYYLPFPHVSAGVVPPHQLPELYSRCDCALVLSLTNLSLLPLELMACGCPVVSNRGKNVEWQLIHEENALLADATPDGLANALLRLLGDPALRGRLRSNGLSFARSTDWASEARRVHGYLEQIRMC